MLRQEDAVSTESPSQHDAAVGVAYGLAAYLAWGVFPAYFKLLSNVSPLLVLAQRVVWSFAFLVLVSLVKVSWTELLECVTNRRTLALLACSTIALATNWGVFIWAVTNSRVLQSSLGYFMCPLVSVALGVIILKERLRPMQVLSLALAVAGVTVLTVARGQVPWVGLALAFSFGSYGLLRKVARVGPLVGVMVETALLLPISLAFIAWTSTTRGGEPGYHVSSRSLLWLVIAGVITALPLLWFTAAAKRLRLTTLGFLQYVTPILQFLLALLAFHEKFGLGNLAGFACIWIALAVFSIDSLVKFRDGGGMDLIVEPEP
jgi:chloramphenicol-sensitive protein RarD